MHWQSFNVTQLTPKICIYESQQICFRKIVRFSLSLRRGEGEAKEPRRKLYNNKISLNSIWNDVLREQINYISR